MAWIDCSTKVLSRPDEIVLIIDGSMVQQFGRGLVLTLGHILGSSIVLESMRYWIAFLRVLQVSVVWPGI